MSEPIKVGDTVIVVRGHVCDIGKIDVVQSIEPMDPLGWHCTLCDSYGVSGEPWAETQPIQGYGYPLSWLKKIPPLEELQTWRQTDETTA